MTAIGSQLTSRYACARMKGKVEDMRQPAAKETLGYVLLFFLYAPVLPADENKKLEDWITHADWGSPGKARYMTWTLAVLALSSVRQINGTGKLTDTL